MSDNGDFHEWGPTAAAADHHKPRFHLSPPYGWMNDPNGLVWFDGYCHAFYQHHPHSPTWGPMHWGHARSRDMMAWEHLPIALYPDSPFDAGGCWSGTAHADGGTLVLAYTGFLQSGQVQNIATSTDGIAFTKSPANPVISCHPPEGSGDFRDPKLWKRDGTWYMMAGTCRDGLGKVALYSSEDLSEWRYLGIAAGSRGELGGMWECPDLFELDGHDVLVYSPIGMPGHKNICMIGKFDYGNGGYLWQSLRELDWGTDFYAAQTLLAPDGRRILMAWMDMWGKPMPSQAKGWSGALTLPREISFDPEGRLVQVPIRELLAYRRPIDMLDNPTPGGWLIAPGTPGADCLDMELTLNPTADGGENPELRVFASEDDGEYASIVWDRRNSRLMVLRERSGAGNPEPCIAPLPKVPEAGLDLRVVLDRSSVEVFALGGLVTITCRVYPKTGSTGVALFNGSTAGPVGAWTIDV